MGTMQSIKEKLRKVKQYAREHALTAGLFALCKPKSRQPRQPETQTTLNNKCCHPVDAVKKPETYIPSGTSTVKNASDPRPSPTAQQNTSGHSPIDVHMPTHASDEHDIGRTWTYDGESTQPYTGGLRRLILAYDGASPCVALLPDQDLAQKLREAILENREVNEAEYESTFELGQLDNRVESIGQDVHELEGRIADLHDDKSEGAQRKLVKLRKSLGALLEKRSKAEEQLRSYGEALEARYRTQRCNVDMLLRAFEEMLVESKVLHSADEKDEVTDALSTTSKEARELLPAGAESLDSSDDDVSGTLLLHRKAGLMDLNESANGTEMSVLSEAAAIEPLSEEHAGLVRRFEMAQVRLRVMEDSFDRCDARFEAEAEERDRKLEAGEEVESDITFDLHQLQLTQRLARQLAEAEDALEEAKAAAVAAGAHLPGSDLESGFVDDVDDGYRISWEQDATGAVNPAVVMRWVQDVPEEDTEEPAEPAIDDWDAISVNISDSASMVADGQVRKRIDRWRAACESLRSQVQSEPSMREWHA
ncbi:hypothetical protein LTR85_001128 [Meristemomyces frigidus]|nr:hypothetical protein LTR85_001128 [Meristemomyces frigidus]